MNQAAQAFHLITPQEMNQIFMEIKLQQVPGLLTVQQSLLLNLAVVYTTQSQFADAQDMLNQVESLLTQQTSLRLHHTIYITQLFIFVAQGDKKKAVEYVRSSNIFPPEVVQFSSNSASS